MESALHVPETSLCKRKTSAKKPGGDLLPCHKLAHHLWGKRGHLEELISETKWKKEKDVAPAQMNQCLLDTRKLYVL